MEIWNVELSPIRKKNCSPSSVQLNILILHATNSVSTSARTLAIAGMLGMLAAVEIPAFRSLASSNSFDNKGASKFVFLKT
jgi:hypothetical protein